MRNILLAILPLSLLFIGAGNIAQAAGGASSSVINFTTTGSTVSTAAGTLYDMMIATGTTNDYAVCFDSASTTGLTVRSVNPIWQVSVATNSQAGSGDGVPRGRPPATPVVFASGLSCFQSAVTHRTFILYRSP